MTLTEFILAQLAEDEVKFAVNDADRADPTRYGGDLNEGYIVGLHLRLLADVEAKRAIVEEARRYNLSKGGIRAAQSDGDDGPWLADRALRLLALPYADHESYDESWRP